MWYCCMDALGISDNVEDIDVTILLFTHFTDFQDKTQLNLSLHAFVIIVNIKNKHISVLDHTYDNDTDTGTEYDLF